VKIEGFMVAVSAAQLTRLREQLVRARCSPELDNEDWKDRTNGAYLRDLVACRADNFDWREPVHGEFRTINTDLPQVGLTAEVAYESVEARRSRQVRCVPLRHDGHPSQDVRGMGGPRSLAHAAARRQLRSCQRARSLRRRISQSLPGLAVSAGLGATGSRSVGRVQALRIVRDGAGSAPR
jgi:hypothetical protein